MLSITRLGSKAKPDVVVVPYPLVQEDARRLVEAPLLAVEVLSPGSYEREPITKRRQYAAAGLRHDWVVGPDLPEVVVFGGEDLPEVARAAGDEEPRLEEPFTLTLRPSDLLRWHRSAPVCCFPLADPAGGEGRYR